MDENDRRQRPPEAGDTAANPQREADLRRVIHKAAWTRMYGRNDAENPYSELNATPALPGDRRQG